MKMKIILLVILTGFCNVALAAGCRDAYLEVKNQIFNPDTGNQGDKFMMAGLMGFMGSGVAGTFSVGKGILVLGPAEADSVGTSIGVGVGVATSAGATTVPTTVKYLAWKSKNMDEVIATIEEARVGVGYHLQKIAKAFNVPAMDVADIVANLDYTGTLCKKRLATQNELLDAIKENLKAKSLNNGELK